jgi:DNA mismatch repair protein MutS
MVHSHNFYNLYQTSYDKYRDLYGSQVCVFLQKGSFFEIYGQEDPKTKRQLNTGKQILELLSLQTHIYEGDGPEGTTGFYGGVPVQSIDKWAGKLTQEGWTVIIIEELKNGAGKVSDRIVAKVLSAGTHLESAEKNKSFFVASLWLETGLDNSPPIFGVAATDLTTGQVLLYEGRATGKADCWNTDDLRHFFQICQPRELLIHVRGPQLQETDEELRRTLYIPKAPIHRKYASIEQQGVFEKPFAREEYLRSLFQPKTALPLRTWLRCTADGSSQQERALVCLLRFAEDHAPDLAKCLQAPTLWHPTQSLQVINNAITQLNLIGNQEQCVEDLFHSPITTMGKRSLTVRLCSPVADPSLILQRQKEIEWILSEPNVQKDMEQLLRGIFDMSRLHRCIIRGCPKATDVIQLYQSYQSLALLIRCLENSPFSSKSSLLGDNVQECITHFSSLFDISKAMKAQERADELGFLLTSVAPKTATAEASIQAIYEKANRWLEGLIAICKGTADSMYYKPTEKNTYCIHTTKTMLKQAETTLKKPDAPLMYKGIETKVLSSAGRIAHPSLDEFQNQLDGAKAILERCLAVELPPVCIQYAQRVRHLWQSLEDWIINVDLSYAFAKTAKEQGWIKPVIEDTEGASRLCIKNLRHPLIEARSSQSKYVTHDVSLGFDDQQGWLLYGMNASGKSSLMKAIGLSVLLAQVGSYVPATEMTLKPFQKIATRILNQDNLWAGLSSFAVEMSELRDVLAVADDKTLVLGDELCAGTESISGTAIVAAGIQHLYKAGSRFVLATHLHDLMKLPAVTSLSALQVYHLHVEYNPVKDCLIYHRTLRPGSGSSIYGLEVAKALHLPRDMIEAAFEMRRTLLGTTSAEESATSQWNSTITRKACSACGAQIQKELEVHHLQERALAKDGRNADGTALNHVRNLAVLCEACHDKHHAGSLVIGPVVDTTNGPERQIVDLSQYAHTSPATRVSKLKFTTEQIQEMRSIVTKSPGLTPRLWIFQIRQEAGIEITESQFKTLQKKGEL